MAGIRCPKCNGADLIETDSGEQDVTFEGVTFSVTNLHSLQCPNCNEIVYGGNELQRLKQIKEQYVAQNNPIPGADEVKRIRAELQLSVAQFAALLGVTRQAVYSWEDPNATKLKFGPAALLLSLLALDSAGSTYISLLQMAHNRGQLRDTRSSHSHTVSTVDVARSMLRPPPKGGEFFSSVLSG